MEFKNKIAFLVLMLHALQGGGNFSLIKVIPIVVYTARSGYVCCGPRRVPFEAHLCFLVPAFTLPFGNEPSRCNCFMGACFTRSGRVELFSLSLYKKPSDFFCLFLWTVLWFALKRALWLIHFIKATSREKPSILHCLNQWSFKTKLRFTKYAFSRTDGFDKLKNLLHLSSTHQKET